MIVSATKELQKVLSVIGWTITGSILIAVTANRCHAWILELSN